MDYEYHLQKYAGPGDRWYNARGWCAFTTPGTTGADALATALYPADSDFLLSKEGQQSLVDLHVDGICAYLCNS